MFPILLWSDNEMALHSEEEEEEAPMPGKRGIIRFRFLPSPQFSLSLSLSVIIFFFHMIGGFDVCLTSRNIITQSIDGIIRGFGVRGLPYMTSAVGGGRDERNKIS